MTVALSQFRIAFCGDGWRRESCYRHKGKYEYRLRSDPDMRLEIPLLRLSAISEIGRGSKDVLHRVPAESGENCNADTLDQRPMQSVPHRGL
jgi:hypothetical protein